MEMPQIRPKLPHLTVIAIVTKTNFKDYSLTVILFEALALLMI